MASCGAFNRATTLDEGFDASTLHLLRDRVAAFAIAAGLKDTQTGEVVLAVHELAANAVRHGAGTGRLLMHSAADTLSCEVSDAGPAPETWPVQPGHGLWIVQELAARVTVSGGPGGFRVTAVFDRLPARLTSPAPAQPNCRRLTNPKARQ